MKLSNYNFPVQLSEGKVVLFNTVTNKYALFEHHTYDILESDCEEYFRTHPEGTKDLLENGFLVKESVNELLKVKNDFFARAYNSSIYSVTLIPTTSCNLACEYCFVDKNARVMSAETCEVIEEYLTNIIEKQSSCLKYFQVKWFGGEPLLCPEIIEHISDRLIKKCDKKGIVYHAKIFTNLTTVTSEIHNIMKKSRINEINTTLDGYGEYNDRRRCSKNGKNYFDTIIKNILDLKDDFCINIQINIDRSNQQEIPLLLNYLMEKNILEKNRVTVGFNLVNDNDNITDKEQLYQYSQKESMDLIDKYQTILGEYAEYSMPAATLNCFAMAKNSVVIDAAGKLYKCYKSEKDNISFGTVFDKQYELQDTQYQTLLCNPFHRKECLKCSVFPLCYGGCYNENKHTLICSYKYILERKIKRYFSQYCE